MRFAPMPTAGCTLNWRHGLPLGWPLACRCPGRPSHNTRRRHGDRNASRYQWYVGNGWSRRSGTVAWGQVAQGGFVDETGKRVRLAWALQLWWHPWATARPEPAKNASRKQANGQLSRWSLPLWKAYPWTSYTMPPQSSIWL